MLTSKKAIKREEKQKIRGLRRHEELRLVCSVTTQIMKHYRSHRNTATWWDTLRRVSAVSLKTLSMIYRLAQIQKATRPDSVCMAYGQKNLPNCKQHAATKDSMSYWPMLVWKLENGKCSCYAMHWRKTAEGNLRPVQLQLMLVRNCQSKKTQEHAEKCGENIWTTLPKSEESGKFSIWPGALASFRSRIFVDSRSQENSGLGRKEGEINVWSHPLSENISLHEPDRPLSLEERRKCKTPLEIQAASCAPGRHRERRRRIQSSYHRARCFSVSDDSGKVIGHYLKDSWYGWRNKWRSFSVHSGQNDRRYQIVWRLPKEECPELWIRIPPRQRPKSWDKIGAFVVPLERNLYGHPSARLLWDRTFEEVHVYRKLGLFSSVWKRNTGRMLKHLHKEIDVEDPTP